MEYLVLGLAVLLGSVLFQDDAEVPASEGPDGEPEIDPEVESGTDPVDPVDTEEVDDRDLGATVTENADGSIAIELGEDELGSLTALKFEQRSNGENFDQVFSLGIYLVPAGAEIPIDPTGVQLPYDSIEDMISSLGLTELVSFDLGTLGQEGSTQDTRVEPPSITSDDPIDIIRVPFFIGDGGEFFVLSEADETLSPFEEAGIYSIGVELVRTDDDYTGTDGRDFVLAEGAEDAAPVRVNGLDGTDVLISNIQGSVLEGGDGNDSLYGPANGNTVLGGAGDDTLFVGAGGTAFGGAGSDSLSGSTNAGGFGYNELFFEQDEAPEDLTVNLYGGAGNDILTLSGMDVNGFGGSGNDTLTVGDGARGFGGSGNDFFGLDAGAVAGGDEGDDTFQYIARVDFRSSEDTVVLTGGAGADRYEFAVSNIFEDQQGEFLRITDFDPAEDVLVVQDWSGNDLRFVGLREAPDGSYTDVVATYTAEAEGLGNPHVEATIRLEGVTGFSLDQLVA
ncbi:calcium-binding protein [Sulfitobacter guttiformis]|uniref:Hemolysin type calcium-binding protein n=1 Tax=Sulfitobacter guttiformis TaxID=74349 RepID=A0A420DRD4_9RHOB|nr:hypothetical protein [Sulfitobacter guttiformis]KIN74086.1 putative Hemolysin-type calcium-binding toxin, RTX-like oscillin [Sulfitobacter guttiformis KCTC 32187]RKE96703.1 hypothetical protein C8N30_1272 [Sulfitobacter guttiformis]